MRQNHRATASNKKPTDISLWSLPLITIGKMVREEEEEEEECGMWQMDDREPGESGHKSPETLWELVSWSTMVTEEEFEVQWVKQYKYLTERDKEPWDRIFYCCRDTARSPR